MTTTSRFRQSANIRCPIIFLAWCSLAVIPCRAQDTAELLGSASCSSAACHGGNASLGPSWNSALPVHLANDPHAGAGILLRSEASRRMVTKLNAKANDSIAIFDNVLRARCISCHATVSPAQCEPSGELEAAILGHGVSCESCHGPSDDWIDEHVRKDWKRKRDSSQTAFLNNDTILGRTQTCIRCHVGSRTADGLVRDVNHDLIAVGHPPLRFDLLNFQQNLPPHWDPNSAVEKEFFRSSVRLRAIGHAAGLAAAADLASQRAQDHLDGQRDVPWPELADYDCFACHQSLRLGNFQLPTSQKSLRQLHLSDGLPVWNAWYSSRLLDLRNNPAWLAALSPTETGPRRLAEIGPQIRDHFQAKAREAAASLPSPTAARGQVMDDLLEKPPVDWHTAAVQYLRIEAVVQDLAADPRTIAWGRRLSRELPALRKLLQFDASPSEGHRILSPHQFDASRFRHAALRMFDIDAATSSP